jgi:hypothetical protein
VVVGDDQVEAERACTRRASAARMPQSTEMTSRTPSACSRSRRRLQAVAVADTLGDEVDDVRAEQLQRAGAE